MKTLYIRTAVEKVTGHGGGAIGYDILKSDDKTVEVIAVAAKCHPNDMFSRPHARLRLAGRLDIAMSGNREKLEKRKFPYGFLTLDRKQPISSQLVEWYEDITSDASSDNSVEC